MVRRNRAALLGNNLPQLQNMIKRDLESYKEEFLQQYRHFESSLSLFEMKPSEENAEFGDQVTFLSQVVKLYPEQAKAFPTIIIDLLSRFHMVMDPDLRKSLVQALILLKNKGVIASLDFLSLFFTLFRCQDKLLRVMLYNFIVNDIKEANSKMKNNRLNATLQNYLFTIMNKAQEKSGDAGIGLVGSENIVAAKKSLQVCIELYEKNVWNDAKTVNIIAEASLSPISKITVPAAVFFLGTNAKKDDDESDDDLPDIRQLDHQNQINKKTKSRARKRDRAIASLKKRNTKASKAEVFNFSALHLINDPQVYAEKLFSRLLKAKTENFEVKLVLMKLIARVVGIHKVLLFKFYPHLISYLQPQQREVTQILALTAQACHEMVPPEDLEPIIMAIANKFVTDTMSNEVISVGLNALREISARTPLAMNATLLQDLTQYKKNRDKSVVMAARSLISLFREIDPSLLARKDRGRSATMAGISGIAPKPLKYGEVRIIDSIQGTELLDPNHIPVDTNEDEGSEGESDVKELEGDEEEVEVDSDPEEEDDEEEEESVEEEEPPKEKKAQVASKPRVETLRILTDQDFKLIKKRQREIALENIASTPGTKRKQMASNESDSESEESDTNPEIVDEGAITKFRKRHKQDYQERLESIQAGREGRAKYGSTFNKKTDKHSTSNLQKKKTKNFKMMSHKRSVRLKSKMSLRDKQMKLRKNIEKQKKFQR
ncbi:Severe Depolymerization of Actin [Entomophthora muscae]|uniref:Severe Depolymerization of Actin n=1 Tax=Entomophthora muscae TaxID=34485 RepID=A0ACC2SKQ0_9FUNG|nr:Severe Depolymerization of Actin [Entomophthora muscae]